MLSIQFGVLRQAWGLPATEAIERPSDHTVQYATFEQGPDRSDEFPHVKARAEDILPIRNRVPIPSQHGFSWRCPFCAYGHSFKRITSFWAHVRTDHEERSRDTILTEVRRSAQAYQAWILQNRFNYDQTLRGTWTKLIQAQEPTFDWQLFNTWTLDRDRKKRGRPFEPRPTSGRDPVAEESDHPILVGGLTHPQPMLA